MLTHPTSTVRHPPASSRGGPSRGGSAAGFTLVELVVVLTLAGILATIAGPRFFDRGTFDERGYYDELASALRYAQKLAVASGCPVRVTVTAAGYALAQQSAVAGHCDPSDTAFPNPVRLPDGQVMSGTAPAGVAVAPASAIVFGAAGDTNLPADRVINVGSRAVTVVARSGLVRAP